ncbi:hypothetical protein [Lichenicoccus sp.]|uniref:hypothetical protein n=1 Tax=Lichenicoccus sp. TaxID=2781899 RepID=UPI003D0C8522
MTFKQAALVEPAMAGHGPERQTAERTLAGESHAVTCLGQIPAPVASTRIPHQAPRVLHASRLAN